MPRQLEATVVHASMGAAASVEPLNRDRLPVCSEKVSPSKLSEMSGDGFTKGTGSPAELGMLMPVGCLVVFQQPFPVKL